MKLNQWKWTLQIQIQVVSLFILIQSFSANAFSTTQTLWNSKYIKSFKSIFEMNYEISCKNKNCFLGFKLKSFSQTWTKCLIHVWKTNFQMSSCSLEKLLCRDVVQMNVKT